MESPKLHSAKLLGGIGSILMLFILVPVAFAGGIIALVGFVLVLVAVKYLADELNDHNIFTNYLLSFIIILIGVALFAIIVIYGFFSTIAGTNWTSFQNITNPQEIFSKLQSSGLLTFLGTILIGLAVLWIVLIISAIFLRKSFNKIAADTKTHLFHTAGLLFLIGAALTIVFGVGLIIIFVAYIIQIIAFFTLPDTLPGTVPVAPPPVQQAPPYQP
jgi:uncharacterized membrane protein